MIIIRVILGYQYFVSQMKIQIILYKRRENTYNDPPSISFTRLSTNLW